MIPRISKKKIADLADFRRSREYILYAKKLVNLEFEKIKKKFIKEIVEHPVSIEIASGPSASNTSNTLGGEGNLYSYIGFQSGSRPIDPIVKLITEGTVLSSIIFSKNGSFRVVAKYPTAKDIFNVTPLPWAEGRSWAEGIEKGLSGFGFYLNTESDNSRSGAGIQVKNKIRKGKFSNRPYISGIVKLFEAEVHKLNQKTF